jgi:hypothetical protein
MRSCRKPEIWPQRHRTNLFYNRAGAGALSGKLRDIGISDDFMKELGETFPIFEAANEEVNS